MEVVQPGDEVDIILTKREAQRQDNGISVMDTEIDIKEIKRLKFTEESLLLDINQWAMKQKFRLTFREGRKRTKKGFRRVLGCPVSECNFKLTFKSNMEDGEYLVDLDLAEKYNRHSKIILINM